MMLELAFALFFSHILTDFFLQPNQWVANKIALKHKAWELYAHTLLAGVLAFVFLTILGTSKYLGLSKIILLIPLITIPHFCIDLWKLNQGEEVKYFIIDQILHSIHLTICYFYYTKTSFTMEQYLPIVYKALLVLGAFLLLTTPTGILIGKIIKPFHNNLDEEDASKSLPEAGKMIGMLERTFILIFVLLGQFSSIGFLISAKAILRFSDHKKVENPVRMSEYVIIGTLLSFLCATLVGLLTKAIIGII